MYSSAHKVSYIVRRNLGGFISKCEIYMNFLTNLLRPVQAHECDCKLVRELYHIIQNTT